MIELSDRRCFGFAVAAYGLAAIYSIFIFRRGFRRDDWVTYLTLFTGFVLHTLAMFQRGFSLNRCPINNLYEATVFVMWTITAAYLLIGSWSRLRFLGAFAAPLLFGLGVFALMPALDAHGPKPAFAGGWSEAHKALILLAYGAFGLSGIAGLMYLLQDRNLKFDKKRAVLSLVPPIQRLESVVSRLMIAGFVLLTGGLLASAAYLRQTRQVYFSLDAQVVYGLVVWALYLGLLLMRWCFARRGRSFALGAVGSFAFVMLTFWGVYLLSGLHKP